MGRAPQHQTDALFEDNICRDIGKLIPNLRGNSRGKRPDGAFAPPLIAAGATGVRARPASGAPARETPRLRRSLAAAESGTAEARAGGATMIMGGRRNEASQVPR